MPRNTTKKGGNKRYNVPAETLERARAELKDDAGSIVAPVTTTKSTAPAAPKVQPKRAASFAKSTRVPTLAELREEYRYVWRELRSLGLLLASLFVVILIAAVVLPRLG